MQLGSSSLIAWSLTRSSLVSFWLDEVSHLMSSIELSWTKAGDGYILGKGEKKGPLGSLRYCLGSPMEKVQGCPDQEVPCLRYVHKALANTFFARKATGTINEGEVKLLDMGIKPIISRTRDGKKIRGDRAHAGNSCPP
ncbi:unnamed protein product [Microthlaspi erraticum]|uniref:Arabidopsis retrotransposon Orf1 C-terminal domain-containing protein n=1 Tax=Microthlaspi erraticum TaxID=1685480 RepID=A0A6D2HEE6_9BRAS|nr:unnamed protein product [Microthlaspi erraticum]